MAPEQVDLYCDGASRGNPGLAAAGAVIVERGSGKVLARLCKGLGRTTNNQAEYEALLMGLTEARRLGARELRILADSELVVRQLKGEYKVRHPKMRACHARALQILDGFGRWEVEHIPRQRNAEADSLANQALNVKVKALAGSPAHADFFNTLLVRKDLP